MSDKSVAMQLQNLWVVVVGALLLAPGCAMMGSPTTRKIDELNNKAMAEWKAGKPQKAEEQLKDALDLANKQKVADHPSVAQTHMNLGVVSASSGQRKKAVDEMVKALLIAPKLEPNKAHRNAKVDKAFASAQKRAEAERKLKAQQKPAPVVVAAAPPPSAAKVEEKPAPPSPPVVVETKGKGKKKGKRGAPVAEAEKTTPPPAPAKAEATKPEPTKPEPVTVAPVAPPADGLVEAALPDPVPEPVFCPLQDEVPPGKDLPFFCALDPSLHAKKAVLFVRPPDQAEFTKLEMQRSPQGWWGAVVPGATVKGNLLQFYVEAAKSNGEPVSTAGNSESPNFVLVRPGVRAARPVITQAFLDGDDVPPPVVEAAPPPPPAGFEWKKVWIAFGAGSAYGWHSTQKLEFRQEMEEPSGTASAGTFHVLPEVGYRLNERWSASLQVRFQVLPNEGTTGGRPGGPAPAAFSALLRGLYEVPLTQRLSLSGSAYLGGGEGARFVTDPVPTQGRAGTDSVRTGPVLVGVGVGGFFGVTQRLAVSAELRSLVGLPDFGVLGEVNLGLRYSFQ
ncbi:MAG: tetratricopeptide repeat protein [Deltaproteobacteria bacterium]|nr:tetratricopeptide repeat protein [Deltaproteobacteria bacterium]